MNKLKLKYVQINFKDGNTVVFSDAGDIDYITVKANPSETHIIVTVTYNKSQNEVRHEDTIVYNSKDITEIRQRWL